MKISVLFFCCALIATSCSFLSSEAEPPDDTAVAAGPEQSEPFVQPWPNELATVTQDAASINAGVIDPTNESGWYVAGSMNKVAERQSVPFVLHAPNGNDGTREELPLGDATLGSANAIHVGDDSATVVGSVTKEDGSQAVVWRKDGDVWQVEELEAAGKDSSTSGISADGSIIFGSNEVDNYDVPAVWRKDGDTWQPVEVDTEGRVETDTYLTSLIVLDDRTLLGVGSQLKDSVTRPLFWTGSDSLKAETPAIDGLDEGFLSDIAALPDGTISAVGANRVDEVDSPLHLQRTLEDSIWQDTNIEVEPSDGRFFTTGFGLSSTTASGDKIYISMNKPFLQDPLLSTDSGASWNHAGFIESAVAPQGIGASVFNASGDSLLIGSGSQLAQFTDGAWTAVSHPELPLSVDSAAQNNIHVIDNELVITGTTYTNSGLDSVPTSHMWTGTKDDTWTGDTIADRGFKTVASHANNNQLVVTANAEEVGDWSASLIQPSGNTPQTTKSPGKNETRVLFGATLSLGDGSTILSGRTLAGSDSQTLKLYFAPEEGPLQDAPTEGLTLPGSRPNIRCITPVVDRYLAVIQDELSNVQLATSADGKSWQAQPIDDTFDQFESVSDCRSTGDSATIWGYTPDGTPLVASSTDLIDWSITEIGGKDDGVYQVVELAGVRMALGFVVDDETEKEVGHVWFDNGSAWESLTNETGPTGFEPDEFSGGTSIWNAVEYNDEIVFMGSDRNRVGLWHIPTADLVELAGETA